MKETPIDKEDSKSPVQPLVARNDDLVKQGRLASEAREQRRRDKRYCSLFSTSQSWCRLVYV